LVSASISNDSIRELTSVAHELGHAFGLLHEHQRPDRNDHVVFQCNMIVGYDAVLKRALADGLKEDDIRLNARIATEYGFAVNQFVQNGELVDHGTGSKDYDINSIMHYTSKNFAGPLKYMLHRGDPDWYPLVSKAGGGKQIITEPAPFLDFDITDTDAQGIKAMYPWVLVHHMGQWAYQLTSPGGLESLTLTVVFLSSDA
jgi:hypothetical protein